jgi:hypothetical protein
MIHKTTSFFLLKKFISFHGEINGAFYFCIREEYGCINDDFSEDLFCFRVS